METPSTKLSESNFASDSGRFLEQFSRRCPSDLIGRYLDGARGLSVLFVGETIIDEYQYCETLGKSGKEPVLAVRYVSTEQFAGGVLAAANQAAVFCDRVAVLSLLGTQESREDFIRQKLHPGIEATFLSMPGSPTILKRRIVELYPFQKLFEIYVMDQEISAEVSRAVCARLQDMLPDYDAVVVTDYGHGMMTAEVVEALCRGARFLAVNTQANAGNQGYNTISKYPRADYFCLSEREIRLEARSRQKDLQQIVREVAEKLSCARALITRGWQGCLCYQRDTGLLSIPPFTNRIVDRVGAGDALFAVTSLCAAQNAPMDVVGFIGNAVGAQAVEIVGHREVVSRLALLRQVHSLLK